MLSVISIMNGGVVVKLTEDNRAGTIEFLPSGHFSAKPIGESNFLPFKYADWISPSAVFVFLESDLANKKRAKCSFFTVVARDGTYIELGDISLPG